MPNAHNDQDDRDARPAPRRPLTTAEAAALLRRSEPTVRRLGARLGVKVLGRWEIDPDRVAAVLAGGE
jgi:hypothetical protein